MIQEESREEEKIIKLLPEDIPNFGDFILMTIGNEIKNIEENQRHLKKVRKHMIKLHDSAKQCEDEEDFNSFAKMDAPEFIEAYDKFKLNVAAVMKENDARIRAANEKANILNEAIVNELTEVTPNESNKEETNEQQTD